MNPRKICNAFNFLVAGCLLSLGSPHVHPAQANNTVSESLLYQPHTLYSGWRKDIDTLTHFTGMFCPDYIGRLSRSAIVPDLKELGTGCVYETENGDIKVIFRRHKKDTSATLINNFKSGYTKSKFTLLKMDTPTNEVAFQTETISRVGRIESFSAYTAPAADYTVWTSISSALPMSELDTIRVLFKKLTVRIERQQSSR
ncbi:hypothetical protein PsAD2_00657 [Pseudovibrio axinellae]|uniref:Polyketide cyclase / dehydrase and lipid transport n=2 Tax=Pseudovibrio axinellae TaxID=989403 RepID=A0A166ANX1_9HYPH|nr:hypothetical protein PsAD2_00657 [Pseudovibrio axinellae]SEQ97619.1 hypothetical protein SAMN05421798_105280 [Pseudovibrio axinellae]